MTKIEELHYIIELLNKHDLPLSPILEYAIKEKEEELCADCPTVVKNDSYNLEQIISFSLFCNIYCRFFIYFA